MSFEELDWNIPVYNVDLSILVMCVLIYFHIYLIHIAAFHLELHCQSTPLGDSSIQRANKQLAEEQSNGP